MVTEYKFNLNVLIDLSHLDPSFVSRSSLPRESKLDLTFYFANPVNVGTLPHGGAYIPDEVYMSLDNRSVSEPGNTFANGGAFASLRKTDATLGASYGDGLFFHLEPRALSGLPFGGLAKMDFHFRFNQNTFNNLDLPEDNNFMGAYIPGSAKVEMHVMVNGLGTGFDWGVAYTPQFEINVST